ncbi:MAG: hypothetical protein GX625_16620 [Clostridiaceae bacterium]|nr:hypothetical protein [Clostridiaceae bacterium]
MAYFLTSIWPIIRVALTTDKQTRLSTINAFLHALKKQENLLTEFDEKLWCSLVDYATVYDKGDVRFTFKDGSEIKA